MIHFDWPWFFCCLPLPLLMRLLPPVVRQDSQAALRTPFGDDFFSYSYGSSSPATGRKTKLIWLAALGWFLLVTAAARPVWLEEPIALQTTGRDLLLAVDLSGSMAAEDFVVSGRQVTRLTATKKVAGDFIKRREGDRVGLILFGTQPYLQVPLTFDRASVLSLLDEAVIGLAGKETAIGEAIGLGVKRLLERPTDHRVLILLTDGANTAGSIKPLKAAEFAAEAGVTIYTIGIGADAMIVNSFFGRRKVNPSRDLDEKTLTRIAELTEGKYFRARDTAELEQIYAVIDSIEPIINDEQFYQPQKQLYYFPLGGVLLLSVVILLLKGRR